MASNAPDDHRDGPRTLPWAIGIALAAALLVMLIYRRGMAFSPDGWAYWQASVSLLQGDGYCDLFGLRILAWPPLYPLALALVQACTGVSVFAVTLATALLLVLTVVSWQALFAALARRQGAAGADVLWATGWLALVLVYHTRGLRSEALLHVILPWLVLLTLRAGDARSAAQLWRAIAWLLIIVLVGLATRQSAIIFVPSAVAIILQATAVGWRWRWLGGAALALGSGAALLWIEAWLDPTSRAIGPGRGVHGPLEYLLQLGRGLGHNLGDTGLGLLLFCGCLWLGRRTAVSRRLLWFVGLALLGLYASFNLTAIADPLHGRFSLFAALLMVGNGLLLARAALGRRLRWILLLLLFAIPAANVGKHLAVGRGPDPVVLDDAAALAGFAPANAIIDKEHLRRPPLVIGSKVVVSPPLFPWQERRLEQERGLEPGHRLEPEPR